ncbi:hypothetical protein [Shewanella woodyi]|uniref:hypothetical protein n=1 Tax=Shewanella woodyi TaxID=60961 RepID=UPI0007F921EC|nr:hypothetical protein [Shewanella woodyi]
MLKKSLYASLLTSLFISSASTAGTFYDDWDVERVADEVRETRLYYGTTYCAAYIKRYAAIDPQRTEFYKYLDRQQATSEPRPTFIHIAPYTASNGHTNLYHAYQCPSVFDLSNSYIETEVLSYKNKYTPRQPFSTYVRYEFGPCRYGVRQGSIDIGIPAGSANNMKVFASSGTSGYADIKIYDGVPKNFVGYDVGAYNDTVRNFRVKLDQGSSYYLRSGTIPKCSAGGGNEEPR